MDLESIMLSEIVKQKKKKDFTCMWNLQNKLNEQTKRNRVTDIENRLRDARWKGVEGTSEKGRGIKKYK